MRAAGSSLTNTTGLCSKVARKDDGVSSRYLIYDCRLNQVEGIGICKGKRKTRRCLWVPGSSGFPKTPQTRSCQETKWLLPCYLLQHSRPQLPTLSILARKYVLNHLSRHTSAISLFSSPLLPQRRRPLSPRPVVALAYRTRILTVSSTGFCASLAIPIHDAGTFGPREGDRCCRLALLPCQRLPQGRKAVAVSICRFHRRVLWFCFATMIPIPIYCTPDI